MARARNIKPGFFKNEDLIEMSAIHRLLFIGLWTLADRNGILEDRPRRIKVELLPCDSFDIDEVLSDLASKEFIIRYIVDGVNLIHIVNFKKHQNPHHTEKSSGLPLPPDIHGEVTVNQPLEHGGNLADSLIHLFTDSPNHDSLIHEPAPATQTRPPNNPAPKQEGADWFEEVYKRHPKKGDRGLAQQYLAQSDAEGVDRREFDRVHRLWCDRWNEDGPQFAPKLCQWIMDQGWRYEPPPKQRLSGFRKVSEASAFLEEIIGRKE